MAAIVASKVKRLRVMREAKAGSENAESETPQLHHRAPNRSKQMSREEYLEHQKKIRYYQQVKIIVKLLLR